MIADCNSTCEQETTFPGVTLSPDDCISYPYDRVGQNNASMETPSGTEEREKNRLRVWYKLREPILPWNDDPLRLANSNVPVHLLLQTRFNHALTSVYDVHPPFHLRTLNP